MLKINLSSFSVRQELSFDLTKDDISLDDSAVLEGPLHLELALTKDSDTAIIVEGSLKGRLAMSCSRCLKDIIQDIEGEFVTIFKEKSRMNDEDRESDVLEYKDNELDLTDFIRQTVLIEAPIKPVCDENCLGLCPVCGKNRNEGDCGHKQEIKFNPFGGLDIK
ncbi:MAG: DUF177 domain-containing protein [Candidatus Goldbacteria bacterium]|nr:DUF177 domain-containing protein [Candidatus Goldiibacteriota bacterium]